TAPQSPPVPPSSTVITTSIGSSAQAQARPTTQMQSAPNVTLITPPSDRRGSKRPASGKGVRGSASTGDPLRGGQGFAFGGKSLSVGRHGHGRGLGRPPARVSVAVIERLAAGDGGNDDGLLTAHKQRPG